MPSPHRPPRPNTVLLHIGPHKTGTTAIQRTLLDNAVELASRGLVYPPVGFSYFGHHRLAALLERPDAVALSTIAGHLHQLRDRTVILSSENFSRSSVAGVRRLASLLSDFQEVEVIFYLRNFLELLYPWWQELVKHRNADELGNFLIGCLMRPFQTHLLDAGGILEKFAAAFDGRVSIYLYDRTMHEHGDVARHFMQEILGITSYQPLPDAATINKSLDPAAVEIVRCLNRSGEFGITVLQRNVEAKSLQAAVRKVVKNYERVITLNYNYYVLHQMELYLAMALRKLDLWQTLGIGGGDEIFEKRQHKIHYLDPSIWLMEAELAAQMRAILQEVASNRSAYARAPLVARI